MSLKTGTYATPTKQHGSKGATSMSKQNNTKTNAKSSATKTKRGVVSPSNHATMRATPSKTPTTASKRRKIEELELTIVEAEKNIEKLNKNKRQLEKKVDEAEAKAALQRAAAAVAAAREPPISIYNFKVPQELFLDTLVAWEYLNIFRVKLSLPALSIEAFVDLISFVDHDSVGVVEVYTALLRVILSDRRSVNRIMQSVPKQLSFEHRSATSTAYNSLPTSTVTNTELLDLTNSPPENSLKQLLSWFSWSISDSTFDCSYNGLSSLPRNLFAECITPTSWQAVLRCVILRLEPVKQMRKQLTVKAVGVGIPVPMGPAGDRQLQTQLLRSSSNSSFASHSSGIANAATSSCNVLGTTVLGTSSITTISYGLKLNWDAVLSLASDASTRLASLYEACTALETNELYSLSPKHKLAVLLTLIEACNSTEELVNYNESCAKELEIKIFDRERSERETRAQQRAAGEAKRADAIQACKDAAARAAEAADRDMTADGAVGGGSQGIGAKEGNSKGQGKGGKGKGGVGAGDKKANALCVNTSVEPSPGQVSAMIEELIALAHFDVQGVADMPALCAPAKTAVSVDEDDEIVPVSSTRLKRLHRKSDRSFDYEKALNDYESRRLLVDEAETTLERGLETGSERDLKRGVSRGTRAGLKWSQGGKTVCTPLMRDVLKALYQLEMSAKEEYEKVQYEKAEAQFLTRVEPLGKDRHGRVYWMFPGSEDKLFVQVPDEEQTAVLDQRAKVFEDCPAIQEMFNEMPAVKLLYQCRYSRRVFKWGFYDSAITLWHLCDNFDSSNAEERELVKLIKARYTIQEPASPFLTEGSEYIGRHVKRVFNKKAVVGRIVGWWPQDGDDPPLWHVQHLDGDEEDLELHELLDCLLQGDVSDAIEACADGDDHNEGLIEGRKVSINEGDGTCEECKDPDGEGEDIDMTAAARKEGEPEPAVIRSFPIFKRNYDQVREGAISLSGLQCELFSALRQTVDAMKRHGGPDLVRNFRKSWEETLRIAFTIPEYTQALLELEDAVHSLQATEDLRDEIELQQNRVHKVQVMIKEGWIFESEASEELNGHDCSSITFKSAINADGEWIAFDPSAPLDVIGRRVRRFFAGFGKSDGTLMAYLPPDKNEGLALWHMVHDDGDEEDLEEADVEKVIRHHATDAIEDDPVEGSDEVDDYNYEDDDYNDEDDDNQSKSDGYSSHLWPTAGVRRNWRMTVERSSTVGEVSLCLMAFMRYATQFGAVNTSIGPDDISRQGRKRNGELSRLMKGIDMSALAFDSTRESTRQRRKSLAHRKKTRYS